MIFLSNAVKPRKTTISGICYIVPTGILLLCLLAGYCFAFILNFVFIDVYSE